MARRSDHSREELHEKALRAARDIVEQDGLQALTARRIAAVIGYSPGTLYNVFRDLNDLIIQLNGRTLDELHRALTADQDTGDDRSAVERLLDGYLAFVRDNRNLWAAVFEYRQPDAELPDWFTEKILRLMELVEDALAPSFPDTDRENLADASRVLWAGLHGIWSLSDSGKLQIVSDRTVRQMAEMLVTSFISGLAQERRGGRLIEAH